MNRKTMRCGDCGSYLHDWTTELRCPWATTERRRRVTVDDLPVIWCDQPYTSVPDTIVKPVTGVLRGNW